MLRCQFLYHVLKALFFIKTALNLCYFFKKKMQNYRALGALTLQTPLTSGDWGLRLRTPKTAPIANFWLRAFTRDSILNRVC